MPIGKHHYCAFAGRRDDKDFAMSHTDILEKYGAQIKMIDRIPDALSGAMGNQMYVAIFNSQKEVDAFYQDILALRASQQ